MPPPSNVAQPKWYKVRIKGHLGSQWSGWFEGLNITLEENGITQLSGPVIDDAELHGILKKIRDLGMPLLSVNSFEPTRQDQMDTEDSQ